MSDTEDSIPAPPAIFEEAARLAPDHLLSVIDPAWYGNGQPPNWAMVGQWRSDKSGQIVEWAENPQYRPSPAALGFPEPTDPVDAAMQLAVTGYGTTEDVPRVLSTSRVAVMKVNGTMVATTSPDGARVVPVFTSMHHLEAAAVESFELLTVSDLVRQIPADHAIYINPGSLLSVRVEVNEIFPAQ